MYFLLFSCLFFIFTVNYLKSTPYHIPLFINLHTLAILIPHFVILIPIYDNTIPHFAITIPIHDNAIHHFAITIPIHDNAIPHFVITIPIYTKILILSRVYIHRKTKQIFITILFFFKISNMV